MYFLLINPYLKQNGYSLSIIEYDNSGLPIYNIRPLKEVEGRPTDIPENRIPFYVDKVSVRHSDRASNHSLPPQFPSFVLAFNNGWNDFGYRTIFHP